MGLHNFIVKYTEDNRTIFYNPINGSLVLVNDDNFNVDNMSQDNFRILSDKLFLNHGDDSIQFGKTIYNRIKYSGRKIFLCIHTNFSCNMACNYCYQNGSVNDEKMSSVTIRQFQDFFLKLCDSNKLEALDLCFIGGEPLLCADTIEEIYHMAVSVLKGIKITTTLVTNGTLITNTKSLYLLKNVKFDCIQVTLDGFKVTHDKYRVFKDGSGTYELILKNLETLQHLNNYNIIINCNLTKDSVNQLEPFLEDLKKRNIMYPIMFSLVFSGSGNECSYCIIESERQAYDWVAAHEIAMRFGYRFDLLYRDIRFSCNYYKENSLFISPQGYIYKCISGMPLEEYEVCHMGKYGTREYYNKLAQLIESPRFCKKAETGSCKFSLICDGGCIFKAKEQGWMCQENMIIKADIKLLFIQALKLYDER